MTSGYVLLNMSVDGSDQMCEMLNGFIECPVWTLVESVSFRIVDNEPIEVAPGIIKVFNKIIEQVGIPEEYF